ADAAVIRRYRRTKNEDLGRKPRAKEAIANLAAGSRERVLIGDDDRRLGAKLAREQAGSLVSDARLSCQESSVAGRAQRPLDEILFTSRQPTAGNGHWRPINSRLRQIFPRRSVIHERKKPF